MAGGDTVGGEEYSPDRTIMADHNILAGVRNNEFDLNDPTYCELFLKGDMQLAEPTGIGIETKDGYTPCTCIDVRSVTKDGGNQPCCRTRESLPGSFSQTPLFVVLLEDIFCIAQVHICTPALRTTL